MTNFGALGKGKRVASPGRAFKRWLCDAPTCLRSLLGYSDMKVLAGSIGVLTGLSALTTYADAGLLFQNPKPQKPIVRPMLHLVFKSGAFLTASQADTSLATLIGAFIVGPGASVPPTQPTQQVPHPHIQSAQ